MWFRYKNINRAEIYLKCLCFGFPHSCFILRRFANFSVHPGCTAGEKIGFKAVT